MKDFAAIDFETANHHHTSVRSVGVVIVRDCKVVDKFYRPIQPYHNYYSGWVTDCHGLSAQDTADTPIFPEIWAKISPQIDGLPLVAHNKGFDEPHLINAMSITVCHTPIIHLYAPFGLHDEVFQSCQTTNYTQFQPTQDLT